MTPPILGIWASQISGHLWAPAGAYDALANVTVPSGGAANITFTGIPTGYKHLQLRVFGRGSTGDSPNTPIQFNADTGANYRAHYLGGNSSIAFAGDMGASQTSANMGWISGSTQGANVFGFSIVDILDYTNTSKYKTLRAIAGNDNNTTGILGLWSGLWMSTAAINSIVMSPAGASWAQYSQISLYGVK